MAEKTLQEKLQAKLDALRISEEAKAQLNKNQSYRALVRSNKLEAARDSLAVNLAIAKERAALTLQQRLAQADAILALSAADRTKLQKASEALKAPKATKAKAKAKATKGNGKGTTPTQHVVTDVRPN